MSDVVGGPGRTGLRIGVIGAGRVGAVLGAALRAVGHEIVGVSAVSESSLERAAALLPGVAVLDPIDVAGRSEVVLLTVPDDAIEPLAAGLGAAGVWRPGRIAVHTSGLHGVQALAPATRAGGDALAVHPAMTFSGTATDLARLAGVPIAVTASPGAQVIGQALAYDLGGEPWLLADADRVRYHAALTHGSNHLVTLVAQAAQLLRETGIDDPARLLRPLLEAALQNSLERGDRALTGPVSRGDLQTVRAHLAELRGSGDVELAYRAMGEATALRAAARHTLPREVRSAMIGLFGGDGSPDPDEGGRR